MTTRRCLIVACAATLAALTARGAALAQARDPVGRHTIALGRSVDGRAIVAVETGDIDSPRKVLVVGCSHGNECAGTAVAARLARAAPPPETDLWILST